MIGLGILIGAIATLVLEAIAAIVLYVVWLRASTRPGRPAAYTIAPAVDAGLPTDDGPGPVSEALADWADARLEAAGIVDVHVSRRYPALRVDSCHIAFWADNELSWLRLGMTFVSQADHALVNEHAPLEPTPVDLVNYAGDVVRRVTPKETP